MSSIGIALFISLFVVIAYLYLKLAGQRRMLLQLQKELRALAEAWQTEQADLSGFVGLRPNPIISIEILNAVEVASKNSKFAELIGKYAPEMIRKMVIKGTAKTMRDQMRANGVQVEVNVHGYD